jgi:hypothetical protein
MIAVKIRRFGIKGHTPYRLYQAVQEAQDFVNVGLKRSAVEVGNASIVLQKDVLQMLSF